MVYKKNDDRKKSIKSWFSKRKDSGDRKERRDKKIKGRRDKKRREPRDNTDDKLNQYWQKSSNEEHKKKGEEIK